MKLSKNTLFLVLLGFYILANILELVHVNFLYTTTLISFCTYILLPGLLISLILRIKKLSFWENLLIIIGLSIVFLELGGLLLNIFLPLMGLKDPLAFGNSVIGFDIYILLLFIFAWTRTKPFIVQLSEQTYLGVRDEPLKKRASRQFVQPGFIDTDFRELADFDTISALQVPLPKRTRIEIILYILPLCFPVLAILGAIILNNGGSDVLLLILLGAIAFYCLLLVLSRDKISLNIYPYAIFFIGITILFITSLRGWYITGADILTEYYVFQLTNSHHLWNMAFYQDAYNACLSITILPTVVANLLSVPDMYVYKVIFQILSATVPVIIFFIMRKYTTPVFAFLSAFFFISFPTFLNDMPMANRQEIGFIFFGLGLYITLLSDLPLATRRILFVIFAIGVIISHYSTNFVFLLLITFVYVFTLMTSLPFVKNTFGWLLAKSHIRMKNSFPKNLFLSLPLVVLLFFMTYFWNTLYTNSSSHVTSVLAEVVNNFFVSSNPDSKSGDLSYSIFFSAPKRDPQQQLQDYISSIRESENKAKVGSDDLYSHTITSKYPTTTLPQEQLAPTPLGNWLSSHHIPVFDLQAELRSLSADFMQISVFIGLFAIIFFRQKKPFDMQYLFFCFGGLFLLILIILLPALSVEYGVLRMFQQLLFVLSLPIVLGLNSVFFFVKEQKRIFFIGLIAMIFFLNLTGFISHLTGDYYPQMTLDNGGVYYDAYYNRKSDIITIVWLSRNSTMYAPVESDSSNKKLLTYGNIYALNENFPPVIRKDAYVYLQVSLRIVVTYDSNVFVYNSPKPFLDDNKNLIYSNGKDNIYK